jgi:hypothetical protein
MAKAYLYDLTDTWNAGATTFTAIKMNATDTASAAGSALMDLQVAGVSQFKVSKVGAVTAVGVAIPTISSTDTLSNKTLSSPTLSGTIAGSVTASGAWTFNGAVGVSSTSPRYFMNETDAGADAKISDITCDNGGFIYFRLINDAQNSATTWMQVTRSGITVSDINFGGGVTIGSPTGGNKGAGTLNATAVYDDNVLLTCYVLDAALDGAVDLAKWDAKVPNRVIPAKVERVEDLEAAPDENGQRPLKVVEIEAETVEERIHEDARKFVSRLGTEYDPLNIDAYAAHWKTKRHLTSMPNEEKFDPVKGMSTGTWIQRLIETVEIQAVHIETLNQRLKALEGNT